MTRRPNAGQRPQQVGCMSPTQPEQSNFFNAPIVHFPDRGMRWLLHDPAYVAGALQILQPDLAAQLDMQHLAPVNSTFVSQTLRQQEADLVYRLPYRSPTQPDDMHIYLLIEHQSQPDSTMQFRLLMYMTQLWDGLRQQWAAESVPRSQWRWPPIVPMLVYTGARHWPAPGGLMDAMVLPAPLARFTPTFEVLFLPIKAMTTSVLTRTNHPFGWVCTVLQQEQAPRPAFRAALVEALSHLASWSPTAQYQRAVLYFVLLILHRRPSVEHRALLALVDEHAHDLEVQVMAESMAEVLMARGRAEGLEQGIEQGLEQGRSKEKQADILKLMHYRFDAIPEDMVERVASLRDLVRLDLLFDQVLAAKTLDDIDFGGR